MESINPLMRFDMIIGFRSLVCQQDEPYGADSGNMFFFVLYINEKPYTNFWPERRSTMNYFSHDSVARNTRLHITEIGDD